MNKEIAEQWAAALASGDYKQGTGQLRSAANEFCCLGVLCNLHAQAHPEIAEQQTEPTRYLKGYIWLSPIVVKWAGLKDDSGRIRTATVDLNGYNTLAQANDRGQSFATISEFILMNHEHL